MTTTDSDASTKEGEVILTSRHPSPLGEANHAAATGSAASAPEPPEPEALSQTIRRMNRRRTRVLAVLSLLVAVGATAMVVRAFVRPEASTPIQRATDGAWAATGTLSDGLRGLKPGDRVSRLQGDARAARKAVQVAGRRVKALQLPIGDTPLRVRVIHALREDDAWISAVGSTLANPRSVRRGDLARLAQRAAIATALVTDDLPEAEGSVGGTGRLLSATKRR